MDARDLERFLDEPRLAHFATVDPDGRPRVRPVWYLWRDRVFWFTTRLKSRRTGRDVASGSAIMISVASEDRPYRAVLASGEAEVLPKDESLLLAISTRYGEAEGRRWTAGAMKEPDRIVLRMAPEKLLSWDYGRGDYTRQAKGLSMRSDG